MLETEEQTDKTEISTELLERLKDYLRDRAIADPRAKQLLQEMEA